MREVQNRKALSYESSNIMTFPDYTKVIQLQRKSFDEVKQKLTALSVPYVLLFPLRLWTAQGSRIDSFDIS
ncbi:hypothetical protein NDU88_007072 [Pleurodeles waltl]|uniref:Uncharacterized protein n=1 Tax=Pleurodeles waltl TaxID=8319 RepID=A0AAV7UPF2_PLEWA|nr:hypothetical protein NDU88_007072 [Pleurodeles waltl]